jgi:hypothetical protein
MGFLSINLEKSVLIISRRYTLDHSIGNYVCRIVTTEGDVSTAEQSLLMIQNDLRERTSTLQLHKSSKVWWASDNHHLTRIESTNSPKRSLHGHA